MFCQNCGGSIKEGAKFCTGCGSAVNSQSAPADYTTNNAVNYQPANNQNINPVPGTPVQFPGYPQGYVPKNWLTTLMLCIFLAAHRVYTGHIGTGIAIIALWVIGYATAVYIVGIFFLIGYVVWWIIDLIAICNGKFKDSNGYPLHKY
ncbi:MAG: hypothetical protein FWD13_02860 [Treponema sp.]|nr:hypothetical protein [Treponema sp.]